jgi:NhaA family Na+:H+ antiporter
MAAHHDTPDLVQQDERLALRRAEEMAERLLRPFHVFARQEVSGGIVLFVLTLVALAWANSPWADAYEHLLHEPFGLHLGDHRLQYDLHHWINDGLMAVFFFVVGLEIKREVLVGELAEPRKALLPIGAAAGGMLVPALVFLFFNAGQETARGWGIPMATDIAFALGVLALLGKAVPEALKVFLVALAIVDDLGAVLVIAVFYTASIDRGALGLAALFLAALVVANQAGFRHWLIYLSLGIGLWYGLLLSGVHATLAGVLAAFTVPARVRIAPEKLAAVVRRGADTLEAHGAAAPLAQMDARHFATVSYLRRVLQEAKTPLQRFEHMLHPWVTFGIMPVFALFNAGIPLDASAFARVLDPLPLGIAAGLALGKQIGVFGIAWALVKLGLASLPQGVSWRQLYGAACLAGIGFTMSLFINGLAFARTGFEADAKLGILLGSIVAGVCGFVALSGPRTPAEPEGAA